MELSYFLAKFIGLFLVIISIALLLDVERLKDVIGDFVKDKFMVFFSGELALLAGLPIVIAHNIWVADWPVIITIFGWLGVLKGLIRLLAPQLTEKVLPKLNNKQFLMIMSVVYLGLGLYLTYVGFMS